MTSQVLTPRRDRVRDAFRAPPPWRPPRRVRRSTGRSPPSASSSPSRRSASRATWSRTSTGPPGSRGWNIWRSSPAEPFHGAAGRTRSRARRTRTAQCADRVDRHATPTGSISPLAAGSVRPSGVVPAGGAADAKSPSIAFRLLYVANGEGLLQTDVGILACQGRRCPADARADRIDREVGERWVMVQPNGAALQWPPAADGGPGRSGPAAPWRRRGLTPRFRP